MRQQHAVDAGEAGQEACDPPERHRCRLLGKSHPAQKPTQAETARKERGPGKVPWRPRRQHQGVVAASQASPVATATMQSSAGSGRTVPVRPQAEGKGAHRVA